MIAAMVVICAMALGAVIGVCVMSCVMLGANPCPPPRLPRRDEE